MKKLKPQIIIPIIVAPILLLSFFLYQDSDPSQTTNSNNVGRFGNGSAAIHLIVSIPPEAKYYNEEVRRFQNALSLELSDQIQSGLIFIRTIPEPQTEVDRNRFIEVLRGRDSSMSDKKFILLSPFEGEGTSLLRSMAHIYKIPFLFHSLSDTSICGDEGISPYLWNIGITPNMYVETYLTYLSQKYGKLASELNFFLYLNLQKETQNRAEYYDHLIKGLGFEVKGGLSVDDRQVDLYTTLRRIFEKKPDLFLGFMTPKGRAAFFPQASKLGISLEMGFALDYGTEEEELRMFSEDVGGLVLPVSYVADIENQENIKFKNDLEKAFPVDPVVSEEKDDKIKSSEIDITMASYRGFVLARILDRLIETSNAGTKDYSSKGQEVDQILNEDNRPYVASFIGALKELDGTQFDSPAGPFMLYSDVQGLIQALHVAEFKDGTLKHLQYLGDITLPPVGLCVKEQR